MFAHDFVLFVILNKTPFIFIFNALPSANLDVKKIRTSNSRKEYTLYNLMFFDVYQLVEVSYWSGSGF